MIDQDRIPRDTSGHLGMNSGQVIQDAADLYGVPKVSVRMERKAGEPES